MATARRRILITYSGEVDGEQQLDAADNNVSPAVVQLITLAAGNNTIAVPTAGSIPTAVTIVPPGGNEVEILLKGSNSDGGFRIHDTDPTSVALHQDVTEIVLQVPLGTSIAGVRLYWS